MISSSNLSIVFLVMESLIAFLLVIPLFLSNSKVLSTEHQSNGHQNNNHHVTSINETNKFSNWEPPLIIPPRKNMRHTGTLIFLHDYGQYGEVWNTTILNVAQPYMKVIFPTAKEHNNSWNRGMLMSSWFRFYGQERPLYDEKNKDIDHSTAYIHHLIDEEIKNGTPSERIILSGFKQGAVLALHAALTFHKKLGGVAVLSIWDPVKRSIQKTLNPANKGIPIFLGHKSDDFDSPGRIGLTTRDLLKKFVSNDTHLHMFSERDHIAEEEMEDMKLFCLKVVPTKQYLEDDFVHGIPDFDY